MSSPATTILTFVCFASLCAIGADDSAFRRQIQSTTFTRDLLIATNASDARTKLGIVSGQDATAAIPTIADLLAVEVDAFDSEVTPTYRVLGYAAAGDGGGGDFYWDADSTASTNLGTIFAVDGVSAGRWIRVDWDGNVRAFGAVGDGTTDDAPAIQAAINAGNRVRLSPGDSFRVVGPLFMTNSNFELDLNRGELVLNDDSGNASLRTIPLGGIETWTNVTALIATNITIRNGSIRADQMATGKNLVLFHGINGGLIEDVSIFGNGTNASWALSIDGWNIRVSDCFVDNRGALLQDGIHVFGGTNIVIENCIVLSGDDSFPVGSDYNRTISDVLINNCYGSSTHGWPIKVYTALTGPSGEMPDGLVSRVHFSEVSIRAGSVRNGAVAIFDWAFDIYSGSRTNEEPPRLIRDVQLSGINVDSPVPDGNAKEVEPVPDLYIIGSERLIVQRYVNPTPWNNTLLVAPRNLKIADSHIGAPVRTNQATVQWLATGSGHTNYSYGIEFDRVRFDLRNDVATYNIAPFYVTNLLFSGCSFEMPGVDGSSALYLGETVSDVSVDDCTFLGVSTNGAIYWGAPKGKTTALRNRFTAKDRRPEADLYLPSTLVLPNPGDTITINGDTRAWAASTTDSTVEIGADIYECATNLHQALTTYPVSDITVTQPAAHKVHLMGSLGDVMTVSETGDAVTASSVDYDITWNTYRGAMPESAWWSTVNGSEWRSTGTTDFQVTTNGVQVSRATTPSTPPAGALQLEVESLENVLVMRRASGVSANLHLAGGRLNLNSTGGQLAVGDNYTTTTAKIGSVVGIHYDTAQEPLGLVFGQMTSTGGVVNIGGGSVNLNAATEIALWAAANNTTTTGTKIISFTIPAASETSIWLYDGSDNSLKRVLLGADDSGGTGYKILRVEN